MFVLFSCLLLILFGVLGLDDLFCGCILHMHLLLSYLEVFSYLLIGLFSYLVVFYLSFIYLIIYLLIYSFSSICLFCVDLC